MRYVIGILFVGFSAYIQIKEASAQPPKQMQAPEVAIIEIQTEPVVITTELSGRISAFLVAEVRPQVGGIIQKMLFREGSEVKEGDILYQIDTALYEANYDITKATLAKAEATIPPIKYKAERYKELITSNAISRQDYDEAVAALKKAEADVQMAKAEMHKAYINLEYTSIKAPISGRIGKSSITTGSLVTANQPLALAIIQKIDPVYVDVTQSTATLLQMKKSIERGLIKKDISNQAKVKLILEDGSPYTHEGILKFSDVTVDIGTGSISLRTEFPNSNFTLLPGMYVKALVEEGINENAVLVPQQSITRNSKGTAVAMLVDNSGKVSVREVHIDRAIANKWLVRDGLKAGDRIIVEGFQKIRPGDTVKTVMFK